MGRYKQREAYHFGIDYVKAYVKRDTYRKSRIDGLSRNSDLFGYDKETHLIYRPDFSSKYDKYFEIRDVPTGVNLAFLMLGKRDMVGAVERRDVFEITGQGLMLRHVNFYRKLLDVIGYHIDGFKRVDICLDVPINTDYVIKNIMLPNVKERTHMPIVNKGKYETLYIGERNEKKNTWKLIRVYDKIEDTKAKGKEFLYQFKSKGIKEMTRFELVLRRDKAKHFHESYLDDTEQLFKIFKHEVFGLNFQFFKFIHEENAVKAANSWLIEPFSDVGVFNLTAGESKARAVEMKERMEKYGSEFKSDSDKSKSMAIFLGIFRKLIGNGVKWEDLREVLEAEVKHLGQKNNVLRP